MGASKQGRCGEGGGGGGGGDGVGGGNGAVAEAESEAVYLRRSRGIDGAETARCGGGDWAVEQQKHDFRDDGNPMIFLPSLNSLIYITPMA